MVKATNVRSNTSLHSEVFVEAITSAEGHGLFGFVTAKSNREVEFANVIRLEEASKGGLRTCKSSKDHSKPRNEVDTSLKSPV